MEVKIGQYLRHENNIYEFQGYCDCSSCKNRGFEEPILQGTGFEYITSKEWWLEYLKESKVADTPVELVQTGDLIETEYDGYLLEILNVNKDGSLLTSDYPEEVLIKDIIKILTLNSDGGYDLQYSKEVE